MSSLDNNTIPIFSQEKIAKSQSFCSSLIPTTPLEPFIGSDDFYHFTYITICNTTHKFYIGKHSTKNLNDGYIGSGNIFRRILKKHETTSFTRHIIKFFNTEEEAFIHEAQILTEDVIKTYKDNLGMCYNLKSGGMGGTVYISEETRNKLRGAKEKPEAKARYKDPEYRAKLREGLNRPEVKAKIKESLKKTYASPEYKEKMGKSSLEAQAKKPLYLPNSTEIVEIHKDDILSKLKEGYRYAGKTAGIYNPNSNESKNIQFFSKHWKIKDPEAQNLNLIQHLELGWVFGWYNR